MQSVVWGPSNSGQQPKRSGLHSTAHASRGTQIVKSTGEVRGHWDFLWFWDPWRQSLHQAKPGQS